MKKFTLSVLVLLLYCSSFAQPYQSIFGKEKTEFGIFKSITCYDPDPHQLGCGLTFPFETTPNDTVVMNDLIYQILTPYISSEYEYIREDTLTGKIYRYIPYLEKEFLICDMALNVGDVFQLPVYDIFGEHPWDWYYDEQGCDIIVKQVDIIDGRKVIEFFEISSHFYSILSAKGVFLKFIEGVGPIYGPLGYLGGYYGQETYLGVLLCTYKDDTLFFMTSELLGCLQWGLKVDEMETAKIKIYPNPTNDFIHIEVDDTKRGGKLFILNSVGMIVWQEKIENNPLELNTSKLATGFYSVLYETDKERIISKFIKTK